MPGRIENASEVQNISVATKDLACFFLPDRGLSKRGATYDSALRKMFCSLLMCAMLCRT